MDDKQIPIDMERQRKVHALLKDLEEATRTAEKARVIMEENEGKMRSLFWEISTMASESRQP